MSAEILDIVDEFDDVVGSAERAYALSNGLVTRVAGCVLFSSRGTIFLQVRSGKKSSPFKMDYSAAGHVLSGEAYHTAACRELLEELGVSADLSLVGTMKMYREGKLRKIHTVFRGIHDGPFHLFADEVDRVEEFTVQQLMVAMNSTPDAFTPTIHEVFSAFHDKLVICGRRTE